MEAVARVVPTGLREVVVLTEAVAQVVKMELLEQMAQAVRQAQAEARVLMALAELTEAAGQVVPMVLVELREARVQVAKMVVMVL
jgi:hypothetical protein